MSCARRAGAGADEREGRGLAGSEKDGDKGGRGERRGGGVGGARESKKSQVRGREGGGGIRVCVPCRLVYICICAKVAIPNEELCKYCDE